MEVNLEVGLKHQVEKMVSDQDTAKKYGSGDLDVYATPAMIALMENASTNCVKGQLPLGFTTVGIEINVKHLRATPVGVKVRAEAILEKVDGKRLFFKVEAYDDLGKIGEGINIRYLVNAEEFVGRTTRPTQ
ncbi:thioesterase family protein [Clostridium akagii]|uniref:thioesterase family protein n=1 Tax=Clostridium akagii TaxID=91623 RepID=UPI00047E6679|nr:thioesterase family protein [Clostridium akagii]